MSCVAGVVGALVASAAAAAYGGYQQNKQGKQAASAARRQAEQQKLLQQAQEQDLNRANRKTADVGAIMTDPSLSASSTSLTGANGVELDPTKLGGGSNLLGG